nr:ThiF family adenylyltransferase [Paludibacteraceae bacterium]
MWTSRTQLLLGENNSSILEKKHVMIVGVGGVGAYAAEMICRAGIGNITIIDADTIKESNINRQLPALHSTIGKKKVTVLTERLLDINPNLVLKQHDVFIEKELIPSLFENLHVDFVIDAIDTLSPKIDLIRYCNQHKIKIVSSMGAGGRTDPSKIHYADISGTH